VVKRDDLMVNLLEDYSTVDLSTVMLSTEYYVTYSNTKIDAENLAWSQDLIMNSCNDEMMSASNPSSWRSNGIYDATSRTHC
jgi:hypothetical protein